LQGRWLRIFTGLGVYHHQRPKLGVVFYGFIPARSVGWIIGSCHQGSRHVKKYFGILRATSEEALSPSVCCRCVTGLKHIHAAFASMNQSSPSLTPNKLQKVRRVALRSG
jgi:hypothetical protein